jgi:hypothetical protein
MFRVAKQSPIALHLPASTPGVVCRSPLGDAAVTCVRHSPGLYIDADGVLQTALAHQPRVGTDGLMIEPQRKNNVLKSSAWSTLYKVAASASVGPWGVPATRLTDNDGATLKYRFAGSTTYADVGAHTFSIFARAAGGGIDGVRISKSAFGGASYAEFDLANGTLGQTDSVSGIEPVAGHPGWHRCWAVFASGGTVYVNPLKGMAFEWSGTYTEALDVCMQQVEGGTFPTSPIHTAGASIWRFADTLTVANPLSDGSQWAISVDAKVSGAWSASIRFLVHIGTHGQPSQIRIYASTDGRIYLQTYDDSTVEKTIGWTHGYADCSSHHLVFACDDGVLSMYSDGVRVVPDYTVGAGTGVLTMPSSLRLGAATGLTDCEFGGSIRNFRVARTADLARAGL